MAESANTGALAHFERALIIAHANIQGGTTAESIHLGSMAGCVDPMQRCFGGLETRHDVLWFNPYWPRSSGQLDLAVEYRGPPLHVEATGREVRVSAEAGPSGAIRVGCGEEVRVLRPGETTTFVAAGASTKRVVGAAEQR